MPEYKLSDAELLVMRQFWAHGPMKSDELAARVAEKGWKPTTLLTFLSRLAAKGMLAVEKQGKANLYRPLLSHREYARAESRVLLDALFDGSAQDFLAAMVEGRGIPAEELAEMRAWLARQEVDGHDD